MDQFKKQIAGRGGIYFVSWENPNGKKLVKIGLATNLWRRLDQYLLYYPKGYYIFGLYVCKARTTKKTITELEDLIHRYCMSKNWNPLHDSAHLDHSHGAEWFEFASNKDLRTVIEQGTWVNDSAIETRLSFVNQPFTFYATQNAPKPKKGALTPKSKRQVESNMKTPPGTTKTGRTRSHDVRVKDRAAKRLDM